MILVFALNAACVPTIKRADHVYVSKMDRLEVTKYESIDSDDWNKLFFSEDSLPVEYVLHGSGYTIYIKTPALHGRSNIQFKIMSERYGSLHLASDAFDFKDNNLEWEYISFIEGRGQEHKFTINVLNLKGEVVATEIIHFELRKIGYIYSVDAI